VHVWIREAKTLKEDVLTYYWRSPNPFASTSDWLPITTVTEGQPVRFPVDAEFVTPNIGQYVKVRYSVLRASNKQYEHSATLNLLIGELVGELPPPEVVQAPDKTLNPIDGLNGVDINASYSSMNPDRDMIRLKWLGAPGAGTSDDLELPGSPTGTVQFHLPPSVIGANIAKTVSVEYEVTRYTLTTPSQMLDLYVSDFQDPENELPHPHVPQAQNNVLDLMTFSGDAKAVLAIWPYIALKQRLWFYLTGQTSSGASHTIPLITGQEITPTQVSSGLNESLLRSELMKLGHSTPARVICKVAFDGSENEDTACVFPQLPLTIRTRYDYVQPVITGVTDSRGPVAEDGKTRDEKVTVTGTATRGETVELFDGTTTSMGTALVGADSTWSREIGPLTEKSYRISAKALYDADPVSSEPRTFTVKFAQTPEILAVSDSRGDVAQGATTYDNSVLVAGSATPNLRIKLLENKQSLITLDVDDKGDWNHRINDLKVHSYSLTAEALYEIDPATSPPRDFVVAQAVTPTISRVNDLRGEVAANGTTYYRTVNLTGKASPNEKIILLNAGANVETVDVNGSGDWQYVFSSLNLTTYRLTARGDYGSNPESSPPRVFTVAAFISPTITAITDSVGTVGPNETTYETAVTVKGEATPREQIQLYDNGAPVGTPVSVNADKQWTTSVTGLAIRSHSLKAKALYDAVPVESPARNFNVAAHIAPTLTSVHDGISEIVNDGQTKSASVTLRGTVTPNRQVQIYDNNSPRHTVTAVGSAWNTTLSVGLGGHSLRVKALSTGQDSNTRTFTVISPIPPLNFNTGSVTLSGRCYLIPNWAAYPNFGPGTYVQHTASGGVLPYRYTSSNNNVAAVDGSGLVTVRGNGVSTITVIDNASQSKSYNVHVTGVKFVWGLDGGSWNTIRDRAAARGKRLPSMGELREIHNAWGGRWPMGDYWYWAADSAGGWPTRYWLKNLVNGAEGHVQYYGSALGVCIDP